MDPHNDPNQELDERAPESGDSEERERVARGDLTFEEQSEAEGLDRTDLQNDEA